jgi:hypothetical protein
MVKSCHAVQAIMTIRTTITELGNMDQDKFFFSLGMAAGAGGVLHAKLIVRNMTIQALDWFQAIIHLVPDQAESKPGMIKIIQAPKS